MKLSLLNQNLNFWMPVSGLSFSEKLMLFVKYIREEDNLPDIICLQEFCAGKNQHFIKMLRKLLPEYELILPKDFNVDEHPRSIMSAILIKKDILSGYEGILLDNELPNRVCYLKANIKGEDIYIISLHAINLNLNNQAAWYVAERKKAHDRIYEELINETKKHADNLLIVGDFQKTLKDENVKKLIREGLVAVCNDIETVNNCFFKEKSIDHILVSKKAANMLGNTLTLDDTLVGRLSDHVMLKIS